MRAQQLQLRTGTGRQKCQRHTAIVTHTLSAPGLKCVACMHAIGPMQQDDLLHRLAPAGWTNDGQQQQDHVAHRPAHRQKSTRRYALCLPNGVPALPPTPSPPPTAPTQHDENTAPDSTPGPCSRPPTQRSAQHAYHRRRSIVPTPSAVEQGTPLEGVPERALPSSATPALMLAQSTPLEGVLERLQLPPRTTTRTVIASTDSAAVHNDDMPPLEDYVAPPPGTMAAPSNDAAPQPSLHDDLPPLEDGPLGGMTDDDDDHGDGCMDVDHDNAPRRVTSPASMDAAASSPACTHDDDPNSPNPLSGIRPRKSLGLSRFAMQQGDGADCPPVECALDSITATEEESAQEVKVAAVKKPRGSRKRRDLSPGNQSMLEYAVKTPAPSNENDGARRSKRQKFPALRYWINEHKEYKRTHETMPTVDVVVVAKTPSTAWKTVPDPLYRNRGRKGAR